MSKAGESILRGAYQALYFVKTDLGKLLKNQEKTFKRTTSTFPPKSASVGKR